MDKGIPEDKIHVINVIVDLARFNDIKPMENHEEYIAYCGTASNNKDGVDDLIERLKSEQENKPISPKHYE